MSKGIVSGIILTLLSVGMLTLMFNSQPVKASGTIYIRADGSIDPLGAPISTIDNVTYTLTDNIYDSIVVERDNVIIDGAGYTVQGTGQHNSVGISLTGVGNMTVKNTNISNCWEGISVFSNNNTISENNITNSIWGGIVLWVGSSNNSIVENSIANSANGVHFWGSSNNNMISKNNVTDNGYGIGLMGSSDNVISENNITASSEYGIRLYYSSDNTISRNNIANNRYGIGVDYSSRNTISGNNIVASSEYGIQLYRSSNNVLRSNSMADSTYNFEVSGWELSEFLNDADPSNTVDGKPIYYWTNKSSMAVPLNAGYVALVNCTNIEVQSLNLTKNGQAILLAYTLNSTITNNNITNSLHGVYLFRSSNNTIVGNNITNNDGNGIWIRSGISEYVSKYNDVSGNNIRNNWDGIRLDESSNNSVVGNNITNNVRNGIYLCYGSSNNTIFRNNITNNDLGIRLERGPSINSIYHNNFINNVRHAALYLEVYINFWEDGYPSGGNYWSDYAGVDLHNGPYQNETGSDGIGDTPYEINENNIDYYPLTSPWNFAVKPGDLNFDGVVNYKDASLFRQAYIGEYNRLADFNQDGVVNYKDASLFRGYYIAG